jgi:RNA polymerase sigma-70 factor (ECF subfamily)
MHETTSFEQLFATHHLRLLRMATNMLGDVEEAQDIVAEVFAQAAEAGQPPEVQVITTAVRNRCIDRIRQMRMAERVRRRLPLDEAEFPSWEQETEREQRMDAVSKAIDTELTLQMRRTLLLRYREEKTYREIAETMNISEVAVYKHLRNALERLRKKVKMIH